MKLSKFVLPPLLFLLLVLPLSARASALEGETPAEQEPFPVVVSALDELLTAIESAENGDTIILQKEIAVTKNFTIGQIEKRITITPASDFDGNAMFEIFPFEGQNIVFQNIALDGQHKSALSAICVNFYSTPDSDLKGIISLDDIEVKNFSSNRSNIYLNATDVIIQNCHFFDNKGQRTGGIEIAQNATAKISNCVFSKNVSLGDGGALCCKGQVKIENTTITQNQAVNPDSARTGGGVHIGQQASCTLTDCQITDNMAYLGGGIATSGNTVIIDTVLSQNQGLNGADDIMAFSSAELSVSYSNEMKSIYTENDPIGFYLDNMDNRFASDSNAVFLGESLAKTISDEQYGTKFVFADDLIQPPPEESENPDEQEPPTEPQEPNTPSTSEQPVVPDEPGGDITGPTTPPTIPIFPPSYVPPTIPNPMRPIAQDPPAIQPDETQKQELSCGGVTLDTTISFVLLGYGDGQLHENDPITRAQIVVLLYRSLADNSKSYTTDTNTFSDVVNGAWYYDAIAVLSSAGVINGHNGLFRPNDTLTFGELIAILTRFVEARETSMPSDLPYTTHWAYNNIVTAVAYGWINNAEEIEPDRVIPRGEAVKIVNSIFENL